MELDKNRTWCPKAGCETVCLVGPTTPEKSVTSQQTAVALIPPCAVHCPTCEDDFCSGCKKPVSFFYSFKIKSFLITYFPYSGILQCRVKKIHEN